MIKVRIKEKAEEQGIKNAHRLELAANLSPAAASRLWKGEIEKISMETLDRLCRTLDCQIGELFIYEPGEFQPLHLSNETTAAMTKLDSSDS